MKMKIKSVPVKFIEKKRLERSWGVENILTDSDKYLGKINVYKAGKAGGLQMHKDKDETFHIISGEGFLDYDEGHGLKRTRIYPGDTIHIPPGAVHRIEAITQIFGVEFSTCHYDDRIRVEEDYNVSVIGDEYGLPSTR